MSNYTKEQTETLIDRYKRNPNRDTVILLAREFDKSTKSIIGKLAREGVYQRQSYKTKTGEDPVTKEELVIQIAEKLEIELRFIAGLEKSPKAALKYLLDSIN